MLSFNRFLTCSLLAVRLSLSTKKAMALNMKGAQVHIVVNYLIRYMIYGLVLIVAVKADYMSLYTVILGLFVVKIVILSDAFYDTIRKR